MPHRVPIGGEPEHLARMVALAENRNTLLEHLEATVHDNTDHVMQLRQELNQRATRHSVAWRVRLTAMLTFVFVVLTSWTVHQAGQDCGPGARSEFYLTRLAHGLPASRFLDMVRHRAWTPPAWCDVAFPARSHDPDVLWPSNNNANGILLYAALLGLLLGWTLWPQRYGRGHRNGPERRAGVDHRAPGGQHPTSHRRRPEKPPGRFEKGQEMDQNTMATDLEAVEGAFGAIHPAVKPGTQTTEFWISGVASPLVGVAVVLLALFGVGVNDHTVDAVGTGIGMLLALIPPSVYAQGRAKVKAASHQAEASRNLLVGTGGAAPVSITNLPAAPPQNVFSDYVVKADTTSSSLPDQADPDPSTFPTAPNDDSAQGGDIGAIPGENPPGVSY